MKEQLPVLPAIRPDDDAMADGHAATGARDDLGALRCFGEFLILGQRNPIDDQDPHSGKIVDPDALRIGDLAGGERCAVFEDKGLLRLRPLAGERRQAVEFFLINHGARER